MKGPGQQPQDAERAADLLVAVTSTLDERLAVTADELARSQNLLREASEELLTAFRGAADRLVAARRHADGAGDAATEYDLVLDHLFRAVQHLQSHDLVNQLIDTQKLRVDKMREKLRDALALASTPVDEPGGPEQWVARSRAILDCIVAGIAQIDLEAHSARGDPRTAGSVDLF